MSITGIVIALPEELRTLTTKKLAKGEVSQLNEQIIVAYSGAGSENARNAAELLVSQGATRLISWGCAAGISPELVSGDLVITNRCISAQHTIIEDDSAWLSSVNLTLLPSLKLNHGLLAESLQIVGTMTEKQAINLATNAIALDMESIAVAKVAKTLRIPFLIVRAIADPLNMNLPQAVSYALDSQGIVNLPKLFTYLLTHPGELPELIKLGLRFNKAQKTLKLVASQLEELTISPQAIVNEVDCIPTYD